MDAFGAGGGAGATDLATAGQGCGMASAGGSDTGMAIGMASTAGGSDTGRAIGMAAEGGTSVGLGSGSEQEGGGELSMRSCLIKGGGGGGTVRPPAFGSAAMPAFGAAALFLRRASSKAFAISTALIFSIAAGGVAVAGLVQWCFAGGVVADAPKHIDSAVKVRATVEGLGVDNLEVQKYKASMLLQRKATLANCSPSNEATSSWEAVVLAEDPTESACRTWTGTARH